MPLIPKAGRRSPRTRALLAFIWCVLILGVTLHLFPVLWMVSASFKPTHEIFEDPGRLIPKEPTAASYSLLVNTHRTDRIFRYPMWYYIANSLIIVCSTVALQIPVTMIFAYAVSKLHRGWPKTLLFFFAIGTLMIPQEISTIPRFLLLSHFPWPTRDIPNIPFTGLEAPAVSFIGTYTGVILPACFNAFNFLLFKGFFDTLPNELFESARIDGASEWRMAVSLLMPLSWPVLMVTTYFAFVAAWNSFLTPYILLMNEQSKWPLSVLLYRLARFVSGWNPPDVVVASPEQIEMMRLGIGFNALMALSVIETIPLFIVFALFREQIMKGVRLQGLK
jgi:ABC-type glycerol-3-phosphate transport system permease component